MNTQTMTLNQISEITKTSERTIRRWITSAKTAEISAKTAETSDKMSEMSDKMSEIRSKIDQARKTSKPARFTLEETIEIIKAGGNETLANLLMQNASNMNQPTTGSTLTNRDLDIISALVSKTIAATTELLSGRMNKIENHIEKRQALLPPPDIKPRDAINKLVRDFATRIDMPYNVAWNKLYTEFNYHYNVNVKVCASNRNMPIIDYIETEGMIDQLHAVAIKTFGE